MEERPDAERPDAERPDAERPDPERAGTTGTPAVSAQRVRPLDLRDYADFSRDGARRVRVHATDVLTVDLWCLQPQQSTEVLLLADTDVVYLVLGGNAWFVTDEGELGLGPLGSVLVPAGTAHGFDNRAADALIVVATGSPPAEALDQLSVDAPVERVDGAVHRPEEQRSIGDRLRGLFGGGD